MLDYPLKFEPILKEKIWGGSKLRNLLNKASDAENIGESWEISGVPGDISIVANGPLNGCSLTDLIKEYTAELMGHKVYRKFGEEFPLLIKFIDAQTELSVQLHPNDELAKKRHNSFGKTEMWYVIQADQDAEINVGFVKTISKKEYVEHLERGKLVDILNFVKVGKGDSFFINTGKVHAIGAGVLLAEIQQTSDITYRIYDWDRLDAHGRPRDLHSSLAMDAIDFEKKDDYKVLYDTIENQSSNLVRCEYFTTNFIPIRGRVEKDYSQIDSFIIFICIKGSVVIEINDNIETLELGQTVLVPARNKSVSISGEDAEILEVYIS